MKRLCELLDYLQPGPYIVSSEFYDDSYETPVLTAGKTFVLGYTDDTKGIYRASEKPIILFDDFTTASKWVDFDFKVKSSACKILIGKRDVDLRFVYHAMQSIRFDSSEHKRYWIKDYSQITIPYPNKQKRDVVVKTLDGIMGQIESAQGQIRLCDEQVKSLFNEMFGSVGSNEKGFRVAKLSTIASYWNGLTYKPSEVTDDERAGTLVLRSSNIQNGNLAFEDNVFVISSIKEKQFVKENDILMCSRNGSAKLVGKVALIKGLPKPTSFGAFMMIIRSNYYAYLKVFFESDDFRSQLKTGTSTINQITGKMMDEICVLVPPIEIVKSFEQRQQQIDKLRFNYQQQIKLLNELLEAKMAEYFGGEK